MTLSYKIRAILYKSGGTKKYTDSRRFDIVRAERGERMHRLHHSSAGYKAIRATFSITESMDSVISKEKEGCANKVCSKFHLGAGAKHDSQPFKCAALSSLF